jgi:hypothetical protein
MTNKINFDEVNFEKMDARDFGKLACVFGESKDFHDGDINAKLYEFDATMKFRYKSMYKYVTIMDIIHWFQWAGHKFLKINMGRDIYEYFSKKEHERSLKTEGHDRFFKFIDHIQNIMEPCGFCYEKPGNFISFDKFEDKIYRLSSNADYTHVGYDALRNYKKFINSKAMKISKDINLLQLDVFAWVDEKCSHVTIYAYTMSDADFENSVNVMKNNGLINTLYSKGFRLGH